ncbi:MAG: M23 family metallopeptidase [Balneolaceae bacterium]|jgi:hypothetical protein
MKKIELSLLLPVLFCLLPGISRAQTGQAFNPRLAHYLWPTNATHYLTSTFGETRDGHFHAALDIKTWGQRGYKVFATRDGIVHRIAIGPRGYGKVIYLKHNDGSYSVYAHLLAFKDSLQQLADSIRFAENYKFEIDQVIEDKKIHVKQGDVIGYSGASGIGPPHLHFELRTPDEKPFNPLLTNLKIKDDIPPKILGISVEPRSPNTSIEGKNHIYIRKARKHNHHFELGTITASGPIGLGIDVYDQSNRVHNVYAVYKLKLSVDGEELFKARIDSFSYDETGQMYIDRVYPILQRTHEGYQRLYIADGNSLPFYQDRNRDAVLDLSPGNHKVKIRAEDYFGNASTATLTLSIKDEKIEHPTLAGLRDPKQRRLNPYNWNWFDDWVTLSKNNFRELVLGSTDPSKFVLHHNDIAIDLKKLDNLFMNIPGIGPLSFQRKVPGKIGIIQSANQEGYAIFPRHTFYDSVSVAMNVKKRGQNSIRVDILPEAYPLRNNYKFHIRRDSNFVDISKLSFYKWDREDHEWDIIPTHFTDHQIIAEAESLGSFQTLKDTTAPKLNNPRLSKRPDGQWLVMINAKDDLSGIDYQKTEISVNGIRGIAEYEPEDDRFVYYRPGFTPASSMRISITAFDKMNNKRVQYFTLGDNRDKAKK